MAGVIKRNPLVAADQWEQIGKQITWFNVVGGTIPTYAPADPANPTDLERVGYEADGAVNALVAVIQKTTTIIAMGPIVGGSFSIGVEGIFTGQDNFNETPDDGDLKRMDADIKALGTVIGTDSNGQPNGAGVVLSAYGISTSLFELDPVKVVAIT